MNFKESENNNDTIIYNHKDTVVISGRHNEERGLENMTLTGPILVNDTEESSE